MAKRGKEVGSFSWRNRHVPARILALTAGILATGVVPTTPLTREQGAAWHDYDLAVSKLEGLGYTGFAANRPPGADPADIERARETALVYVMLAGVAERAALEEAFKEALLPEPLTIAELQASAMMPGYKAPAEQPEPATAAQPEPASAEQPEPATAPKRKAR